MKIDFLILIQQLENTARELYNEIKDYPIVSPHGHVDPKIFVENKPFPNPTELFISPDHYVFRMLIFTRNFS